MSIGRFQPFYITVHGGQRFLHGDHSYLKWGVGKNKLTQNSYFNMRLKIITLKWKDPKIEGKSKLWQIFVRKMPLYLVANNILL